MTFLIGFAQESAIVLPIVGVIFFIVIAAIMIGTISQSVKNSKKDFSSNNTTEYTDGNGRTQAQRDYIAGLRAKQAQKKADERDRQHQRNVDKSNSHAHSGKAEHYDPIVGSLGEVSDEGCDELDGVRLVEHDESYCDDESHAVITDYSELQRAIVLGEAINKPRFKYRKK